MEMMFMFPDEKPSEISRCKMRWKMVADHSCTALPERIAPPPPSPLSSRLKGVVEITGRGVTAGKREIPREREVGKSVFVRIHVDP